MWSTKSQLRSATRGAVSLSKAANRQHASPFTAPCTPVSSRVVKKPTESPGCSTAGAAAFDTVETRSPSTSPVKVVTRVSETERSVLESLLRVARLSDNLEQATASAVSTEGLQLVTASTSCESPPAMFLGSMSEDAEEQGDGMGVPLADVAKNASLLSAEATGGMQSEWQPTKGNATLSQSSSMANPRGTLEALAAYQELERQQQEAASLMVRVSAEVAKAVAKTVAASKPLASSVTNAAQPLKKTAMQVTKQAARATMSAVSGASSSSDEQQQQQQQRVPQYGNPQSHWLVADSLDGTVRYFSLSASDALARQAKLLNSDLVTFESYSLGTKINRKLYVEACSLYARFLPLVMEHLEEVPTMDAPRRICFTGIGMGGALATVLMIMFVARGLRRGALLPVYAFNAPPALAEVPDYKLWCNRDETCDEVDVNEMIADIVEKGILAELGLSQDAVCNVVLPSAPNGPSSLSSLSASGVADYIQGLIKGSKNGVATGVAPTVQVAGVDRFRDPGSLRIFNPIGRLMLFQ